MSAAPSALRVGTGSLPAPVRVAVVGGTGMLGRPVVRVLAADDRFKVSVLVRDEARARRLLPANCTLVKGDVRDRSSIDLFLAGADVVYTNLANPMSERAPYDPERDGTPVLLDAAKAAGISRFVRISALEAVHEPPGDPRTWWLLRRKAEADRRVAESGLPHTIFLPAWYSESIPLFLMGPVLARITRTPTPMYWIAGEDYGRQVAAALLSPAAANRSYVVQGPEPLTFKQAITRFVRAFHRRLVVSPMPRALVRVMGLVDPRARYLSDLLDVCMRHAGRFESEDAWRDLGRPTMTVEDYARSIARTGDLPRK